MISKSLRLVVLLVPACECVYGAQASDVGEVRFVNSGAAAAQGDFLHGLALLHNFEYEDAAPAFLKAQGADPGFAMAYWGEAMTHNHAIWMEQDRDAALAVLERLGATPRERLAKAPTQREKDYLQAVETLFGDGAKEQRDFAYAEAMRRVHEAYPQDPDAAAFYALSLLGTAHQGRDFVTYMKAAAILEDVFREHPDHPGAAHYLIHCYDDSIHAPLGLRAARVYSKIAPAAAHAQHMTSHIYMALGMWDEVVAANEVAVSVANLARERRGQPPTGCGHYGMWLLYGYLQQGRIKDARRVLAGCRQTVLEHAPARTQTAHAMAGMTDPDSSMAGSFVSMWARYLIDANDWKGDVAGWTVPLGDADPPRFTYDYMAGLIAAETSNKPGLGKALERVAADAKILSASTEKDKAADSSYSKRNQILQMQLQAMRMSATKRSQGAVELLQQAATMEEGLPYEFGPPNVDKPTRELLGETLLRLGRSPEACTAFQAALARAPRRSASLLGVARSCDPVTAEEARAQLRANWRQADNPPTDILAPKP